MKNWSKHFFFLFYTKNVSRETFFYQKTLKNNLIPNSVVIDDDELKRCYPDIYGKNKNIAIKILRKTSYKAYWAAHAVLKVKIKVSSI